MFRLNVLSFSIQLMEGYQNGRPGRAAVGCVSEVYRHVSGNVTILLRDVAGSPVALAWLPSKRKVALSAQVRQFVKLVPFTPKVTRVENMLSKTWILVSVCRCYSASFSCSDCNHKSLHKASISNIAYPVFWVTALNLPILKFNVRDIVSTLCASRIVVRVGKKRPFAQRYGGTKA